MNLHHDKKAFEELIIGAANELAIPTFSDKSNFNACMTCIGFVGGLIAAVGAILCTSSNSNGNSFLYEAVSVIPVPN